MRSKQPIQRLFWSVFAFLFALSILACLSPSSYAAPGFILRRVREEGAAKVEKKKVEKKKDEKKKVEKAKVKKVKVDYTCEREQSLDTHYSYWSPSYERVVDLYFHQAYAVINEGFFYSEDDEIEYLAGEWFDIVISLETYAVVNGEDVKIRYSVFDPDNNELMFDKVFKPIYVGKNDIIIFRAIPASLLDEFSQLYVEVTLTIEGNNAYGGFWLQTMPAGNEGPLRVGDVVIADPVAGGEANPRYSISENSNYKLFIEYEIDYYLGQLAEVKWSIYDDFGQDIVAGSGSLEPRAGYGYFTTPINIPDTEIAGTVPVYLDVMISTGQFLGRRILELSFTGNQGNVGETSPAVYTNATRPYELTFTYADVVASGADPVDPLTTDGDIYLMTEYYVQGIINSTEEEIQWFLGLDGQNVGSGAQKNNIGKGKQNRAVRLPINSSSDPGNYNVRLDILLEGILHASKVIHFDVAAGAGYKSIPDYQDNENYYVFDGFKVFLPPDWDVTQSDNSMSFTSDEGWHGSMFGQDVPESNPDRTVEEWADEFETDISGTRLTRKSYNHQDEKIITTSFLDPTTGSGENVDLYIYFLVDDPEEASELWITAISAPSDEIPLLYDTFETFLDGLFFTE